MWCVGEYGELLVSQAPPEGVSEQTPEPKQIVELLSTVLKSPVANMATKEYTINAMIKLTARFPAGTPAHALIHKQLAHYSTSMSLELQQRSVEYASLLKLDSIAGGVLERMPAFAKKDRNKTMDSSMLSSDAGGAAPSTPSVAVAAPAAPAAPVNEIESMLGDLLGGTPGPASTPTQSMGGAAAPPPGAGGGLDDLLGMLGSPAPAPAPPGMGAAGGVGAGGDIMGMMGSPAAPAAPPGSFAPFTAWSKNGLVITFACSKDPANPSITNIEAAFTNATAAPMDSLNFQVAVPKYMQLKMTPPSSTSVPPGNSGQVTQNFKVANSMHGQKPVLLKVKIEYTTMGSAVSEMGQVDQFPAGI